MDVTPYKFFRMLAPEFGKVHSSTVCKWLDLCEPLVSKKRFDRLYGQALALLTAHRMKMAGIGVSDDPLADIGSIGAGNLMRVSSYSEGETSIGFNANTSQYIATDAELSLTQYGVQFLGIRRMRIMAISSAGEAHGGA